MPTRYAVDTNVLLRLSDQLNGQNPLIVVAMRRLGLQNIEFCFTTQNLGEFWNVSTRPITRNGFGLSIPETARRFQTIRESMTLLPESEAVFRAWLQLLQAHDVRGTEVHDAHLAAVLEVHQVTHLLTFNGADFKRFPHIVAVHPQDLVRQG
jgi:predicted nucleic acid-binding protein